MDHDLVSRRDKDVDGKSRLQVPSGWKSQGQPGRGRGGLLTRGGSGGNPTAELSGSSHGNWQGKFEGSFISIHSASISTPEDAEKKIANSFSQYAEMF